MAAEIETCNNVHAPGEEFIYDQRFDPYCREMGRIVAIWAHLEFLINQTIWELANVEAEAGACLTAQMIGPGPKIRAMISLIRYRNGNERLITDVNTFCRKVEGLGAQRNRFAHDPISIREESGQVLRIQVTADKRLDFEFRTVTVTELDAFYRKVRHTSISFNKLYHRIIAEMPPWPRAQFEQSPRGILSDRKVRSTDQRRRQHQPPPSQG